MSQLKSFLVALASDRELRDRFQHLDQRSAIFEEHGLSPEQVDAIQGGDFIEIEYEFRADLDAQVADPDVVVRLKMPPICPPTWS
jgi:hypothetical protein